MTLPHGLMEGVWVVASGDYQMPFVIVRSLHKNKREAINTALAEGGAIVGVLANWSAAAMPEIGQRLEVVSDVPGPMGFRSLYHHMLPSYEYGASAGVDLRRRRENPPFEFVDEPRILDRKRRNLLAVAVSETLAYPEEAGPGELVVVQELAMANDDREVEILLDKLLVGHGTWENKKRLQHELQNTLRDLAPETVEYIFDEALRHEQQHRRSGGRWVRSNPELVHWIINGQPACEVLPAGTAPCCGSSKIVERVAAEYARRHPHHDVEVREGGCPAEGFRRQR